jgi:hypothetical protein
MREAAGVMEWWSNDKNVFKLKFCLLHYSNTPKQLAIFTGIAIEL